LVLEAYVVRFLTDLIDPRLKLRDLKSEIANSFDLSLKITNLAPKAAQFTDFVLQSADFILDREKLVTDLALDGVDLALGSGRISDRSVVARIGTSLQSKDAKRRGHFQKVGSIPRTALASG
jgi:hypothetical protein